MSNSKDAVCDFLKRCVLYADSSINRKRDRGEDVEEIKRWLAYRDFTAYALSEVERGELDDWFKTDGEDERKQVVESIEVVDSVILGSEGDLFDSVQKIKPNVITIGHDQSFDIESLEEQLEERGFPGIEVIRINRYERNGLQSSSEIKKDFCMLYNKEGPKYT